MRGWRKKDLTNNLIINKLERRINMCLYVRKGGKPEIAKEDIVCYKIVDDHVKYWKPFVYNEEYSYLYNKVLTAESRSDGKIHPIQHLEMNWRVGCYIINEGFHASFNKTKTILKHMCIIPKGTEYCLGEFNDIVAVNMIVFKSLRDYYWYRIKKLLLRFSRFPLYIEGTGAGCSDIIEH